MAVDPDPTYQAYLNALGFQDTTSQTVANKRTADINARAGFETPELGYQYGLNQEAVNADAMGRGVWSSGEHDKALAQAGHEYQYKLGGLEMATAQSLGDVQIGLASALGQSAQDRAVAAARHWALAQAANEAAAAGTTVGPVWNAPPPVLADPAGIYGANNPNSLRRGAS